jgi:hypothetical protein
MNAVCWDVTSGVEQMFTDFSQELCDGCTTLFLNVDKYLPGYHTASHATEGQDILHSHRCENHKSYILKSSILLSLNPLLPG